MAKIPKPTMREDYYETIGRIVDGVVEDLRAVKLAVKSQADVGKYLRDVVQQYRYAQNIPSAIECLLVSRYPGAGLASWRKQHIAERPQEIQKPFPFVEMAGFSLIMDCLMLLDDDKYPEYVNLPQFTPAQEAARRDVPEA